MTPEAFVDAARLQLDTAAWLHTINAPASSSDIEAWCNAYSGYQFPEDLLTLYRYANGMCLEHVRWEGETVGQAFTVPALGSVEPVTYAMYGRRKPHHHSPFVPRHWFSVGVASDAAFYVALDTRTGEYWEVAPIVPDEAEVIARSCAEYLDWLRQFFPGQDELNRLVAVGTD